MAKSKSLSKRLTKSNKRPTEKKKAIPNDVHWEKKTTTNRNYE